jgi:dTDP-4-dehydrorhamnose reductase
VDPRTRWLVTGSGGQLATAFAALLEGDVMMLREDAVDLRDARAVKAAVRGFVPDVILHTAAYTDVDGAEADEETAFAVNALGTRHLVEASRGTYTQVVSFSTDYVFDGAKGAPYVESDEPAPLNAYGRTKLAQERETLAWVRGTVVRTAWLYSPWGRNFVKTILGAAREKAKAGEPLRVVDDQVGSPTYAPYLAAAVLQALRDGMGPGIYHVAGAGQCSWRELAAEVVALAGLRVEVVPISTDEAGRPAPRPAYSALDSERDVPCLPAWNDGVRAALDELLDTDTSAKEAP